MTAFTITAAQVAPGSGCQWKWATAGETITAGMAVYVTEGGVAMKATNGGTEAQAECVGVALASANLDQPIPYAYTGTVVLATGGAVGIIGDIAILFTTAGSLYPALDISGGYTTVVGALGATGQELILAPFASGIVWTD